jgi:plasmid stability protein
MANLQIKNLPEDLHAELRRRARLDGVTIRDYVFGLIRNDQALAHKRDWLHRMRARRPVPLDRPTAELIAQDRAERDAEMDRRMFRRVDEVTG